MAMKSLGLNPAEQETIDMTNEVGSNGRVYFPDFCKIVLRKYREDSKELLNQALFKVIIQIILFELSLSLCSLMALIITCGFSLCHMKYVDNNLFCIQHLLLL